MSDSWRLPNSLAVTASGFFAHRLCAALVEQGLLSQARAVKVLTDTASDVRASTGDGEGKVLGEAVARSYDQYAAWLMGHLGRLS